MAGDWGDLLLRYPDQGASDIVRTFRGLSGAVAGTRMNGMLRVDIYQTGLRLGVSELIFPFIFVPWSDIHVERRDGLFQVAFLVFGNPEVGRLKIEAFVADRLWRATPDLWPETGEAPQIDEMAAIKRSFFEWVAVSLILGLFVTVINWISSGVSHTQPHGWELLVYAMIAAAIFAVLRLYARLA